MRKFIPFLLVLMFVPLTIYAQNNDTKPTMEDIVDLKTRIEYDENQIELLQNQISELKTRINEVEKQKQLDEKFNQFLEEFNKKQFIIQEKDQPKWTEGDLLTASSTIMAFFGFGILLTNRFTTKRRTELVELLKGITVSSFGIQIIYLIVIGFILVGYFHRLHGLTAIVFTIAFLWIIVKNTREIFDLEYLASKKKTDLDLARERLLKKISDAQKKINDRLDSVQVKIDEFELKK